MNIKNIPSERLRSNAYENKKATIIVVALNVKEERSSEVQTRLVVFAARSSSPPRHKKNATLTDCAF